MKTREKDKEILGRDRDDLGRLIAKGYVDAADLIKSYEQCGEFARAEALRDAMKVKAALNDISIITEKYSRDAANPQQSRQRFGLFNRAYASLNHHPYTDGIDYVGTDIGRAGDTYLRVLQRK